MPIPLKCGSQQLVAHECAIGQKHADYICLVLRRRRILHSHTATPQPISYLARTLVGSRRNSASEVHRRNAVILSPEPDVVRLKYNTLRLCSGAVICISRVLVVFSKFKNLTPLFYLGKNVIGITIACDVTAADLWSATNSMMHKKDA